jgi:hypothetical protein
VPFIEVFALPLALADLDDALRKGRLQLRARPVAAAFLSHERGEVTPYQLVYGSAPFERQFTGLEEQFLVQGEGQIGGHRISVVRDQVTWIAAAGGWNSVSGLGLV